MLGRIYGSDVPARQAKHFLEDLRAIHPADSEVRRLIDMYVEEAQRYSRHPTDARKEDVAAAGRRIVEYCA